jgi:RNA polymerase sigma-70 factor, ECF subfamily
VRPPWRRRAKQFEQTALPYLADVYRLARQMSDEHRAPDLVQETYLRAWKYFDTFEQGTNCRAWLFRILHHVWADWWRQQPRLEIPLSGEEEALVEPYYDWEGEFIKDEFSKEVGQALAQLPAIYRWAVLLADVEELSYQEIAGVMNCPTGTVMSRINRGRRTLARLLRAGDDKQINGSEHVKHESFEGT